MVYIVYRAKKDEMNMADIRMEAEIIFEPHFPSPSMGHIVPRGIGYDFAYT
jgi:hypothetical protein